MSGVKRDWTLYSPPIREPSTPLPIRLEWFAIGEPYLTFPAEDYPLEFLSQPIAKVEQRNGINWIEFLSPVLFDRLPFGTLLYAKLPRQRRSIYDAGEFEPRGPVNDLPAV